MTTERARSCSADMTASMANKSSNEHIDESRWTQNKKSSCRESEKYYSRNKGKYEAGSLADDEGKHKCTPYPANIVQKISSQHNNQDEP